MAIINKQSVILLGLSIVLLIFGYILLGQGPEDNFLSRSVAPVLLIIVYCALLPFAIVLAVRQTKTGGQKKAHGEEHKGV